LHLTTAQIRDSLIALAGTTITPEQVEKVKGLLRLGEAHPNAGTAVVDDLKYTSASRVPFEMCRGRDS
jgi:hypothetical protein